LYGPRENGRWPAGIPIDGARGADGKDGTRLLSGPGLPDPDQGADGDFFLAMDTTILYGPKQDGTWPTVGTSLRGLGGPPGPEGQPGKNGRDGAPGSRVLSGNGPPVAALGTDGDYYLDADIATLYGPKAQGVWPAWGIGLQGPAGLTGPQGLPGADGQDGKDGANGSAGNGLLSGSGFPTEALGRDGDHYLDMKSGTLYGPKAGGAWPAIGLALVGATGAPGPEGRPGADGQDGIDGQDGRDGSRILTGLGKPVSTLGADGDHYIDTNGAMLYGPKAAGAWPATGASLQGPKGDPGPQGQAGAAGATIFAGHGSPRNDVGRNLDYYFDMASSVLWGPKMGGMWSSTHSFSLVGATGPQGPAGPKGDQGIQGIQGVPGADGKDGKDGKDALPVPRAVNFSWAITTNTAWGDGTYFLMQDSQYLTYSENSRMPELLPIPCSFGVLRVSLQRMANPVSVEPGLRFGFTAMRRSGQDLTTHASVASDLSCEITPAMPYCESVKNTHGLAWNAGDAIDIRMVGNADLNLISPGGRILVALYCQE